MNLNEPNARKRNHFRDVFHFVGLVVINGFNANVNEHLQAVEARACGDVNIRALNGGAVFRCLCNRVNFGVNGAHAVFFDGAIRVRGFVDEAVRSVAMWQSRWRAVVACGENVVVAHDNRTDVCPLARRPTRNQMRHAHEVFVPANTLLRF